MSEPVKRLMFSVISNNRRNLMFFVPLVDGLTETLRELRSFAKIIGGIADTFIDPSSKLVGSDFKLDDDYAFDVFVDEADGNGKMMGDFFGPDRLDGYDEVFENVGWFLLSQTEFEEITANREPCWPESCAIRISDLGFELAYLDKPEFSESCEWFPYCTRHLDWSTIDVWEQLLETDLRERLTNKTQEKPDA